MNTMIPGPAVAFGAWKAITLKELRGVMALYLVIGYNGRTENWSYEDVCRHIRKVETVKVWIFDALYISL